MLVVERISKDFEAKKKNTSFNVKIIKNIFFYIYKNLFQSFDTNTFENRDTNIYTFGKLIIESFNVFWKIPIWTQAVNF